MTSRSDCRTHRRRGNCRATIISTWRRLAAPGETQRRDVLGCRMIMSGNLVVRWQLQSNDIETIFEGVPGNNGDSIACREHFRGRAPFYVVCIDWHPHYLAQCHCTAYQKQPQRQHQLSHCNLLEIPPAPRLARHVRLVTHVAKYSISSDALASP